MCIRDSMIRSAEQDTETLSTRGYKDLYIKKPPIKNFQIKDYWITISSKNDIHSIMGNTKVANEKYCLRQIKKWAGMLKERFQKDANFKQFEAGKMNISSYNIFLDNNDFLSARCNSYEDGIVRLWVYWLSLIHI